MKSATRNEMDQESLNSIERAKALYMERKFDLAGQEFVTVANNRKARKDLVAEAIYGIGLIKLARNENEEDAYSCFAACVQTYNQHANGWYYLGRIEAQRGNLELAKYFFKRAIESNAKNSQGNKSHQGAAKELRKLSSLNSFYERLSKDQSNTAKRAVQLMDKLFTRKTPNKAAFIGSAIPLAMRFFLASFFLVYILHLGLGFSSPLRFLYEFSGILEPVYSGYCRYFSDDFESISCVGEVARYCSVLLVFGLILSSLIVSFKLKNSFYDIQAGRLKITQPRQIFLAMPILNPRWSLNIPTGIYEIKTQIVELYRIERIEVKQNFLQKRFNEGTLVLNDLELVGLAKIHDLVVIADEMRELVSILRSISWIKGFVD
jgi:tetratricopeptide (TPR) repeat protein